MSEKLTPRQKWHRELFAELERLKMESRPCAPYTAELYLWGFATVQVSTNERELVVERYYDNELIDIDRNFHRSLPISETDLPPIETIVALCRRLIASIRLDEPILNSAE